MSTILFKRRSDVNQMLELLTCRRWI